MAAQLLLYRIRCSRLGHHARLLMRAIEPLCEVRGRFIGRFAVKRHHGGRHARNLHQVRPPALFPDESDLDQVRATCNDSLDTMAHGVSLFDERLWKGQRKFYVPQ